MSEDQLRELVLDLYGARKDIKEYLDFFIDPDVPALTEKYVKLIAKEINRVKRGYLAARWLHIRRYLKEYESFGPGADKVMELMIAVLNSAVNLERRYYVKPTFINGTVKLASDLLKYGDRHLLFDTAVKAVTDAAASASFALRNPLKDLLNEM